MGGYAEEVFCAHLYGARLAAEIGRPPAQVIDRYLRAYESRPSRGGEALGGLARYCRMNGERWPLAYMYARQAAQIPYPKDTLFVEFEWYEWHSLDELAVAAYWTGEYEESARCSQRLLESGKVPPDHLDRVTRNLESSREKLGSRELVDA